MLHYHSKNHQLTTWENLWELQKRFFLKFWNRKICCFKTLAKIAQNSNLQLRNNGFIFHHLVEVKYRKVWDERVKSSPRENFDWGVWINGNEIEMSLYFFWIFLSMENKNKNWLICQLGISHQFWSFWPIQSLCQCSQPQLYWSKVLTKHTRSALLIKSLPQSIQ